MQIVFGVEHCELRDQGSNYLNEFLQKITSTANVVDRDDRLCIVQTESDFQALKELFQSEKRLEETYELYPLQSPSTKFNTDYGFVSSSKHAYLFKEMTIPFRLNEENERAKMAMLQMEEHLVATDDSTSPLLYFADRQQRELIEQIASAYQVTVTFL
ncbi:hypothetical protein [Pseudalkalibacillus berkeleyi]|uniref:Uncharacterized protein n=1 Tax=Pseudalkalibacillus berkeleyi TaxID=1069813 RepID=A0ABS9GYS1_9BACL|nr:hypothetical protein [Pseudalkalibacillus berkeleyi]MCF6137893.1 hypothetical protein [Pseudalkalibacillus berkeleyi]